MKDTTHRVLVIEDDRYLRRAAEVTLTRHGFAVTTAADGEEGLSMARSIIPDLILLDLIMPKVQGFEVLRQLKVDPATNHIPVIVMSNLGQDRDRDATIAAGAVEYLIKANTPLDELAAVVGRTIGVPVA